METGLMCEACGNFIHHDQGFIPRNQRRRLKCYHYPCCDKPYTSEQIDKHFRKKEIHFKKRQDIFAFE